MAHIIKTSNLWFELRVYSNLKYFWIVGSEGQKLFSVHHLKVTS